MKCLSFSCFVLQLRQNTLILLDLLLRRSQLVLGKMLSSIQQHLIRQCPYSNLSHQLPQQPSSIHHTTERSGQLGRHDDIIRVPESDDGVGGAVHGLVDSKVGEMNTEGSIRRIGWAATNKVRGVDVLDSSGLAEFGVLSRPLGDLLVDILTDIDEFDIA